MAKLSEKKKVVPNDEINTQVNKEKRDVITRLVEVMEKSRVLENLEMLLDRRKLLWNNFLAGLARGLGFGVGLTVLAALVIYLLVMLLKSLVALDIPLIGTYIADIVEIVQDQIKNHP